MRTILPACFALLFSATSAFASGLITPRPYASEIVIPAAISGPGANGTYFRSDIRITNHRGTMQRVYLQWIPRNGGPIPTVVTYIDVGPGSTYASDDFVHEVMRFGDLGAIVARAVDANGSPDPHARIHATVRVWSPQPFTEGTTSQSFPTIALSEISSKHLVILGQRRNDRFRTNVGILNLDTNGDHTFLVTVSGENPTAVAEVHRVTVPAHGVVQLPIEGAPQDELRIDIEEDVGPGEPHLSLWTAYASSVDNTTGDAWSTLGFDLSEDD